MDNASALVFAQTKSMHVARLEKHRSAEIEATSHRTPVARSRCLRSFILRENQDLFTPRNVSPGRSLFQFNPYPPISTRRFSLQSLVTEALHGQPDRAYPSSSGGCYDDACVRGSTIHLPVCGVPLRNRNQSDPAIRWKSESAMRMWFGNEEGLFQA